MEVVCGSTNPLNLWTDRFSFVTILFVKNSVASEAPLHKGYPGALARDSVERASAILRCDGVEYIQWMSCIHLTPLPVYILTGAQYNRDRNGPSAGGHRIGGSRSNGIRLVGMV
jgi:hypothetical protein